MRCQLTKEFVCVRLPGISRASLSSRSVIRKRLKNTASIKRPASSISRMEFLQFTKVNICFFIFFSLFKESFLQILLIFRWFEEWRKSIGMAYPSSGIRWDRGCHWRDARYVNSALQTSSRPILQVLNVYLNWTRISYLFFDFRWQGRKA